MIFEEVAASRGGATVSQLVDSVGLSRTIVTRLLRGLEDRRYVVRDDDAVYRLGGRIASLMAGYEASFRDAVEPLLREFSDKNGVTSQFCVLEGDEIVAVEVVQPVGDTFFVTQRVGARRPVDLGASGISCLLAAGRTWPGAERHIAAAADRGYALSESEVQSGTCGVAVPVFNFRGQGASIGAIMLAGTHNLSELGNQLKSLGQKLAAY